MKLLYFYKNLKPSAFYLSVFLAASCNQAPLLQQLEGITQGTSYRLQFWRNEPITAEELRRIQADTNTRLNTIDRIFSNYRPDSVVEQFNQNASQDPFIVPPEFTQLLQIASQVGARTQGCFDLTIGPVYKAWGFNDHHFRVPSQNTLQDALSKIGLHNIRILDSTHLQKKHAWVTLDFGAIGQGYTVGELAMQLESYNIHHYIVEIGGEMQIKGHKPNGQAWRIALDKPLPNSQKLQKILSLNTPDATAIMTTGTYRHYFDQNGMKYSHILDARNGHPIRHATQSVTLMHTNATVADAWDTALLCLGSEDGLKLANALNLAVLFIDQTPNGLQEITSHAWGRQAGLEISNPSR